MDYDLPFSARHTPGKTVHVTCTECGEGFNVLPDKMLGFMADHLLERHSIIDAGLMRLMGSAA